MSFADVDLTMENRLGVTIAEMIDEKKWDDERINALLWRTFYDLMNSKEQLLIAATPRLMDQKDFWSLCRGRAVTIHLRWEPGKVLRREEALKRGISEKEVVLTAKMKADYSNYYWWRLGHCKKSERELRLTGDLETDLARLVALIRAETG